MKKIDICICRDLPRVGTRDGLMFIKIIHVSGVIMQNDILNANLLVGAMRHARILLWGRAKYEPVALLDQIGIFAKLLSARQYR